MFTGVPIHDIPTTWPEAAPLLRRALERQDQITEADVVKQLAAGEMQLWVHLDDCSGRIICAVVTRITRWPASTICVVRLMGAIDGDRQWLPSLDVIEEWAAAQGCDAVEIHGRKGWERLLPNYELNRVVLRRKVA